MDYTPDMKRLKQWALDNYESGGHWAYETMGAADYARFMRRANNDYAMALAALQDWVKMTLEQESDCRFE
jgi:hypothetical protein